VTPNDNFKNKINIKAYRVDELAGMIWPCMEPGPAPLAPNWEPFTWDNGF